MGTYSAGEYLEIFGGLPEPGECYPDDPDRVRDRLDEEERERQQDLRDEGRGAEEKV